MTSFVLPWRRKKIGEDFDMIRVKEFIQYLKDNPGIRWKGSIPEEDKPINYLEIGVFKGDNIVDVSKSYCKHPESKIYCVDPWIDYVEYPEYKGKIQYIYDEFVKNMKQENLWEKIQVYRDFSHNIVPTFENNFFDIAYVDGNHETDFVYKDAVMVFPKVKSDGYIVFDDYDWPTVKTGVNNFVNQNIPLFKNVWKTNYQLIVQKL